MASRESQLLLQTQFESRQPVRLQPERIAVLIIRIPRLIIEQQRTFRFVRIEGQCLLRFRKGLVELFLARQLRHLRARVVRQFVQRQPQYEHKTFDG